MSKNIHEDGNDESRREERETEKGSIARCKNELLHSIDSRLHEHEEESPSVLHQSL